MSNICLRVWRFQLDDNCNFQVKKFPPENPILTFTAPHSCSTISAFSFSPCVRFFVYAQNFSVSICFLKAASLQPFKLFSFPEKMRIDGFEWHTSSTKLYFWGKNGSYLIDLSAVAEFRDAHMSTFWWVKLLFIQLKTLVIAKNIRLINLVQRFCEAREKLHGS